MKLPLILKQSLKGLLLAVLFVATVLVFFGVVIFSQIPSREKIRGCMTTVMYEVQLCPGSKDYIPEKKISKLLKEATVLTEDSAFWTHRGFDFQEIQRSFERNMQEGRFARGGSTISQQLAKNMFLTSEKSLQRKLLEAIITVQIERSLSKKEILERYLNIVQFGKNLYGVGSASQFYFKKSPANLDLIESAWLAFLLPSPEKYSVSFFKKDLTPFARKRLRQIVRSMYQYQRASADDYRLALGRIDTFLVGGPAMPIPEGLDLDAPEESGEGDGGLFPGASESTEPFMDELQLEDTPDTSVPYQENQTKPASEDELQL